jgi:hypothetical protein
VSCDEALRTNSCWHMNRNFVTAGSRRIVSGVHVFAEKTGLGSDAVETSIGENYAQLA